MIWVSILKLYFIDVFFIFTNVYNEKKRRLYTFMKMNRKKNDKRKYNTFIYLKENIRIYRYSVKLFMFYNLISCIYSTHYCFVRICIVYTKRKGN